MMQVNWTCMHTPLDRHGGTIEYTLHALLIKSRYFKPLFKVSLFNHVTPHFDNLDLNNWKYQHPSYGPPTPATKFTKKTQDVQMHTYIISYMRMHKIIYYIHTKPWMTCLTLTASSTFVAV